MKRVMYVLLSGAMMATMLASLSTAQSQDDKLAEYARHRRKEKQAQGEKKVYDNDNLPRQEHISVVGSERAASSADSDKPTESSESASSKSGDQKADQSRDSATSVHDAQDKPKPEAASTDASDDRQKANDEWQKKIADQKSALELLQREQDVLQREYRLRAAAMYADAGNRLRNSAQWDKEEKQYKEQIDAKQKAVDAAKQQLENTREQARKAGIPAKARE